MHENPAATDEEQELARTDWMDEEEDDDEEDERDEPDE